MTTEREELRLTVSLVDNVSAGLNKIKGEFKDLTEGSGKGHAEKFKRENTEAIAILKRMGGEATEAYKAFGMMRLGALGAAGGVALLGYEVAKQVKEWGELAEKVRSVNQIARTFGIDPAALRNIQEQLEVAGVSAERSIGMVTRFMNKMGEMQLDPRARHDILQGVVHDDEAVKEMERRIDQINNAKTAVEKLNLAQELFSNVERNARKQINPRTGQPRSAEDAAGIRLQLQQQLGYDPALGFAGKLKELSAEQARWDKERNDSLEAYATTLGRIAHQWDEISKLLSGPIFSENSPLVRGAKAVETELTNAKDMLEFVKRGGFDAVLHPNDPEARQRAIDAARELQHERHERMTPEQRAKEHEDEERAKKQEELWRERRGRDPRKRSDLGGQQYASLGTMNDASGTTPVSEWTADPQVLSTADRTKYMKENTTELKRLNDLLMGNVATGGVGGYGFLSGGAGGGGGLAGRLGYGGANGINTGAGSVARAASGAGAGSTGGPASLSDETGNPIDQQTMKAAEDMGKSGDVAGLQKLFAARGYRMSGPACGIIASKYATAAGFKPPPGGAVASNWHNFGEKMKPEDINSPNHSFGSMFGTYNHRRYGGNVGAPLATGDTGGHVMSIVPGTYDPKTGKVDVVDQYGYSHGKRDISDMDLRFAGASAVAAAAARRGGQAPGAGTTPPSGAGGATNEQRNIHNFMRGLSFLETSNDPRQAAQTESGNTGFFRQNATDAAQAKRAGLPDPRTGPYEEQLKANWDYIQKFMPKAAAQIKAGNLEQAGRMLSGHWVGLPGGQQPQNAARMAQWRRMLQEGRDKAEATPASEAAAGGSNPVSRDQIERARDILNRNQGMKVEGSGKLSVDVKAPKGTRVGAQGKGLFKTVEINRQTQMEPAKKGPSQDANEDD